MIAFTQQQKEAHRNERARLKIGDRVVGIGAGDRIIIGTIEGVAPQRVSVAWSDHFITQHEINDGVEVATFRTTFLRGLATPAELKAWEHPMVPPKTKLSKEAFAEAQARQFREFVWPEAVREKRHHRKDEPGMHLDRGNYANQLRYHDEEGILRGRLLHFREPSKGDKPLKEWDHHGDVGEQASQVSIQVDPDCQLQGIATALLKEAFRRNWRIDFGKQAYSLAGAAFVKKFRKGLRS